MNAGILAPAPVLSLLPLPGTSFCLIFSEATPTDPSRLILGISSGQFLRPKPPHLCPTAPELALHLVVFIILYWTHQLPTLSCGPLRGWHCL